MQRTWRQTLLQLLRTIRVLDDKRVEMAVTSDLELGLCGVAELVLLYARRYTSSSLALPLTTSSNALLFTSSSFAGL